MAETKAEQIRSEKEISRGVGRMVGVAALRDCRDTKGTKSYKDAGELVGYAIQFSTTEFLKGISEAAVIALTAHDDVEALAKMAELVQKV